VADVLFGEVNPSGKLPVSFPRSVGQLPVYYYHRPSAKRGYAFARNEPLFPFGFGLSYTTFSYNGLCVSPERIAVGETARVRVEVANTGDRAGSEIVQLYVRDQLGSVTRPVKALKGFRRIGLSPGVRQTVEFDLAPKALALVDAAMQWRVEPGLFDVMVGGSSERLETVTLEVVE
jgi:beta-glucosidase